MEERGRITSREQINLKEGQRQYENQSELPIEALESMCGLLESDDIGEIEDALEFFESYLPISYPPYKIEAEIQNALPKLLENRLDIPNFSQRICRIIEEVAKFPEDFDFPKLLDFIWEGIPSPIFAQTIRSVISQNRKAAEAFISGEKASLLMTMLNSSDSLSQSSAVTIVQAFAFHSDLYNLSADLLQTVSALSLRSAGSLRAQCLELMEDFLKVPEWAASFPNLANLSDYFAGIETDESVFLSGIRLLNTSLQISHNHLSAFWASNAANIAHCALTQGNSLLYSPALCICSIPILSTNPSEIFKTSLIDSLFMLHGKAEYDDWQTALRLLCVICVSSTESVRSDFAARGLIDYICEAITSSELEGSVMEHLAALNSMISSRESGRSYEYIDRLSANEALSESIWSICSLGREGIDVSLARIIYSKVFEGEPQ